MGSRRIGTGREESGGLREGVKRGSRRLPPPLARSRKRLLDVDGFG